MRGNSRQCSLIWQILQSIQPIATAATASISNAKISRPFMLQFHHPPFFDRSFRLLLSATHTNCIFFHLTYALIISSNWRDLIDWCQQDESIRPITREQHRSEVEDWNTTDSLEWKDRNAQAKEDRVDHEYLSDRTIFNSYMLYLLIFPFIQAQVSMKYQWRERWSDGKRVTKVLFVHSLVSSLPTLRIARFKISILPFFERWSTSQRTWRRA